MLKHFQTHFQQQNIIILLRIHVACCEIQITYNQVNCLFSNNYRQENVRGVTAHLNTSTSEDLEKAPIQQIWNGMCQTNVVIQ